MSVRQAGDGEGGPISIFDLSALLLTLTAVFGWINRRFLQLPNTTGLLVMGLFASIILVLLQVAFPGAQFYRDLTRMLKQIDFSAVVMNGMLAFLLFAGTLGLNLFELRERALAVASMALFGTLASTIIVGFGFWYVAGLLGYPVTAAWALVFGALISPTDPVAVLASLRNVRVPKQLEIETQGESLFNDGVGVVLFVLFLGIATGEGQEKFTLASVFIEIAKEALGGIALGVVTGYVAYRAMRAIDDFPIEVLITIALVAATYAIAQSAGVSGPLAVVASGLLVWHRAPQDAMSERTQRYVSGLWTLVDEILNAVLFLLIGLELVAVDVGPFSAALALAAIPIVIAGRFLSLIPPLLVFRLAGMASVRNVPFLTWAGVRGGISVALALSLPYGEARPTILAATYAVVLFSVIVQGSTLGLVARSTLGLERSEA